MQVSYIHTYTSLTMDGANPFHQQYDGVLNYYQGYHDVVTVLLLVTGDTQLTYALTERASHYFFR